MATGNTPIALSPTSQIKVIKYVETVLDAMQKNTGFRSRLLEQDRIYYRELDRTETQRRAALANATGDVTKMQNVTVPVVGPQVDSATAYLVEMFLSSYPVFPVSSGPNEVDVALQIETVLGESSIYFQWQRHMAMCFRDGCKHNLLAAEVDWKVEKTYSIGTDTTQSVQVGVPQEVTFAGNKIEWISLYNLIFDQRVPPSEVHKRGEFAGYTKLITRIELKQLFLDLDPTLTMNATAAFETPTGSTVPGSAEEGGGVYYIPEVNPSSLISSSFNGFNWMQWAQMDTKAKIKYQDMYELTVLYCRIIPKEFEIYAPRTSSKNSGDPQIYKFLIVNQKVVIFAQRMTNAHNLLPIVIGQPIEDGHGLQTKSIVDNAAPYQALASALYNSGLASQRRKVYDRLLYDPSRVNKADIDRVDPVSRIPVKQDAYGTPMDKAIYQIPFRDDGVAGIFGIARDVVEMANTATGSNRVQQGQFQKGNKTRYEVDQVMGNSDARPRMMAVLLGAGWLQPIKDIVKLNVLQYQPATELFNSDQNKEVKINPVDLRNTSWKFKLADGVMPADKFIDFDLFGQVLQFAMAVPQAQAEWDLLGMFAYQLKLKGAKWVTDFRRAPAAQQAYLAQNQAINNPPQLPGQPAA